MTHVSSLPGLEHTSNQQTLYNVGLIDDAISEKKQISFVYNNYWEDKKLHPRREEPYIVNPYQMVANDGKYYLVCNYDKYDTLSNYRVDKMTQVKIINKPAKNVIKSRAWSMASTCRSIWQNIYICLPTNRLR